MNYLANIFLTFCAILPNLLQAQHATNLSSHFPVKVGNIEVVALSDGTVEVDAEKLLESKFEGQVNQLLDAKDLANPVITSINCFLVKTEKRIILVDAGAGELFRNQTSGYLLTSLKDAGYTPDQVTDVLLTHIHLDHTGGLITQGKRAFPNARIHVNKKELDFWQAHQEPQPSEAVGISVNRSAYLCVKPYLDAEQVQPFEGEKEILPGIRTIEMVGHTPGHTLYELTSNREKILFWGDLIHVAAVQLEAFDLNNNYDLDKRKAAIQRELSYTKAAKEEYLIAADHISFPGIGRIMKSKKGFQWKPFQLSMKDAAR